MTTTVEGNIYAEPDPREDKGVLYKLFHPDPRKPLVHIHVTAPTNGEAFEIYRRLHPNEMLDGLKVEVIDHTNRGGLAEGYVRISAIKGFQSVLMNEVTAFPLGYDGDVSVYYRSANTVNGKRVESTLYVKVYQEKHERRHLKKAR